MNYIYKIIEAKAEPGEVLEVLCQKLNEEDDAELMWLEKSFSPVKFDIAYIKALVRVRQKRVL